MSGPWISVGQDPLCGRLHGEIAPGSPPSSCLLPMTMCPDLGMRLCRVGCLCYAERQRNITWQCDQRLQPVIELSLIFLFLLLWVRIWGKLPAAGWGEGRRRQSERRRKLLCSNRRRSAPAQQRRGVAKVHLCRVHLHVG